MHVRFDCISLELFILFVLSFVPREGNAPQQKERLPESTQTCLLVVIGETPLRVSEVVC